MTVVTGVGGAIIRLITLLVSWVTLFLTEYSGWMIGAGFVAWWLGFFKKPRTFRRSRPSRRSPRRRKRRR